MSNQVNNSFTLLQLGSTNTQYKSWFLNVYTGTSAATSFMGFIPFGYANLNQFGPFYVNYNGDGTFVGNSYAVLHINTSDRRLKEQIEDQSLEEATQIITKLKPKTYFWKDRILGEDVVHDPKKNYGFVAQDIAEDFDVVNNPIGLHQIQNNEQKTECIDYAQITAPLVKVVQDLMIQVAELKALLAKNNIS